MQPIAVLLCPRWQKVQVVYDLLEETKVAAALHPAIVLLGVGKDEAQAFSIPKSCESVSIAGEVNQSEEALF